jgi:cobalt-zinc-cadmium efflux system membrane fusion protein
MKIYPFLFLLLFSCTEKEQVQETEAPPSNELHLQAAQQANLHLVSGRLEVREMEVSQKFSGKVMANPSALLSLSAPMGGFVKEIKLLPGQKFTKGQVLVVLEDQQFVQLQQDFLTNQVDLRHAGLNLERQKGLLLQQATAEKTFQAAEAEYLSLVIKQKALEEKLRLLHLDPSHIKADKINRTIVLRAPFSGVVQHVYTNPGKYLSPSEIIVDLLDVSGTLLKIKAFERDMAGIAAGQEMEYSTLEGTWWKARISSLGNQINDDGSWDIYAVPAGPALAIGTYVQSRIPKLKRSTTVLPSTAVLMFENKWYAFEEADKGKYILHEVQIGEKTASWTEIRETAELEGKQIVTEGAYGLLMALKNSGEE